jgi:hypothetical protein
LVYCQDSKNMISKGNLEQSQSKTGFPQENPVLISYQLSVYHYQCSSY